MIEIVAIPRWFPEPKPTPRWLALAGRMSRREGWTVLLLWAIVCYPLWGIFGEGSVLNEIFILGVGAFWLVLVLTVKARRERRTGSLPSG